MPLPARVDFNAIPIDQYTLSGQLVRSYDSISHAAKHNGLTVTQLMRALKPIEKNGRYSTAGYYWRKRGQALGELSQIPGPGKNRQRVQLCRDGQPPVMFPSQTAAAKFLDVPQAYISQALERQGKCKGYEVSRPA